MHNKYNILWLRRDLRFEDNTALNSALADKQKLIIMFIFDGNIIDGLHSHDPRVNFIYKTLFALNKTLEKFKSSLLIKQGDPARVWRKVIKEYSVSKVFTNRDYEPYAISRDEEVEKILDKENIPFLTFRDQVIFEPREILKPDLTPYTIFTPYSKKWIQHFKTTAYNDKKPDFRSRLIEKKFPFPTLTETGFSNSKIVVRDYNLNGLKNYYLTRDVPSEDSTTYLGPHLRFGTVSIRKIANLAAKQNNTFLNELIWREFFMQILYHFPDSATQNFKRKYDGVRWINNENDYEKWIKGETGYPLVDAGMRQLNETGYMHNRVRMVCAGFLCKHLLIDWRLGEAFFAEKLLDFELSSNIGNWQWAAGTGCDAAPYFRIFNPELQRKRFDPNEKYIKTWIPEYRHEQYIRKMVDHDFARKRAIENYKNGLEK